jgi:hypothetical protein
VGELGSIYRFDSGVHEDGEEAFDVSSDEGGELFESLAVSGSGIGVSILSTSDREGNLLRVGIPRVRSRFAHHRKEVIKHFAKGITGHTSKIEPKWAIVSRVSGRGGNS